MRTRLGGSLLAALAAGGLLLPSPAAAHGLGGPTDLPVPGWLFAWVATLVLAISFAALAVGWRTPRLEPLTGRRVGRVPGAVRVALRLVGLAAFGALVYAGLKGTEQPDANLAPTLVWVVVWLGVPLLSVLLGDVFRLLAPWRTLALAARALGLRRRWRVRELPERVGRWPAAAGLVLLAWFELVSTDGDDPRLLAVLALVYGAVQLAGIALWGLDRWSERGDPLGVAASLFAAAAPLELRDDGELRARVPLSGLCSIVALPGTVAVLCALLGGTTFDGLSGTALWSEVAPGLTDALGAQVVGSLGLALAIAIVAGLYRAGSNGVDGVVGGTRSAERFVHTLVPIALAYLLAHALSLLIARAQALPALLSDPLGDGSDLLGTAGWGADPAAPGTDALWALQVATLVLGHVAALVLAHERALAVAADARDAVRSQYWMLSVMVAFTSLGLYLLSTVAT